MKLEYNLKYFFKEAVKFLTYYVGGWLGPIGFFPVLHLLAINWITKQSQKKIMSEIKLELLCA